MTYKDYTAVLLEEIRDQNKAVLEYVGQMPRVLGQLDGLAQDVAELKQDMKVVKAAVIDMSEQLADHERRIASLEAA